MPGRPERPVPTWTSCFRFGFSAPRPPVSGSGSLHLDLLFQVRVLCTTCSLTLHSRSERGERGGVLRKCLGLPFLCLFHLLGGSGDDAQTGREI